MSIAIVRTHRVCYLSRTLYDRLKAIDPSKFPGDWISQLGSSTISIGSNWCEAYGRRGTDKAPLTSWRHARGSAYEAAFQFEAVGMNTEASIACMIANIIDQSIANNMFNEDCSDPYDVLAASAPDHGSAGEPLKTAVAPWVGTATSGRSMGREALHLVPTTEPQAEPRPHGDVDVGRPADRNLAPSGNNSTDAVQDETARDRMPPEGISGLPSVDHGSSKQRP